MKSFESYGTLSTPPSQPPLDPLQFEYRPNRSIDDAITIALHTALTHLDKRNTYVRNAVQ
jgi:hypothetical protein